MSIPPKLIEIIKGRKLSARPRATCSTEQIEFLRVQNDNVGEAIYTGKPDPNMLERYSVVRAPVSRLITLIDESALVPDRKTQAIIDVTTETASLPYIAWDGADPEPIIINGNHRIFAFNYLCFKNTDIVCPVSDENRISEWLSSDTKP